MSGDINVLALVKGAERYVFLYDDASRSDTLRVLGRFASNPDLSFTWYDAAVLSQKVRQGLSRRACWAEAALQSGHAVGRRRNVSRPAHAIAGRWQNTRGDSERCKIIVHLHARECLPRSVASSRQPSATNRRYQPMFEPARSRGTPQVGSVLEISGSRAQRLGSDAQELRRRSHVPGRLFDRVAWRAALAGPNQHGRSARLCGRHARGGLRQNDHRPAIGLACAAFFASASATAGPRATRPSRCAIRVSRVRCPIFFRPTDLGRLLECAPGDDPQGLRDRAILETLYSAGLRVSELVGLNDDDVDRAGCVVRVRGKGQARAAGAARLVRDDKRSSAGWPCGR